MDANDSPTTPIDEEMQQSTLKEDGSSSGFSDFNDQPDDESDQSDQHIEIDEEDSVTHAIPRLFGEPLRITFTMKRLGMKVSYTRNANYYQKYLLKKASKQWAKIRHAMGHSKLFSIERWLANLL